MVERLNLKELHEKKAFCHNWRDYLKKKIKHLIVKYYYDKPIYVQYFKRHGSYHNIRKILEELVEEKFLIKYQDTRPVYYLYKKGITFYPANKFKR